MTHYCKNRHLAGATIAAILTLSNTNALAARLDGRVSDSTGTRFLGAAIVTIEELNLRTTTARDGRYVFPDVPAGSYTLVVDFVGAERVTRAVTVGTDAFTQNVRMGADLPPMENVLVWGQKAQAAGAINQQRAANNIVSVVTASDAGALPDANIAEALQRAPGVFIERDQGEGRFVGIRGLAPSLNTTRINGVNVPAPDSGERAVALDVIPSDLLENIEVSKTFTPDMDGDFIGGTINVKSLSGFDRDGQFYSFGVESGYNDLVEEWSPEVNGTYSNIFDVGGVEDSLAVAGSLSYQDRDFGSDNLEHDGGWTAAEANGNLYPEEPEFRDYDITRERFGAAFNVDWRPTDTSEYYLRTLYSDFEDDEIRNRIEIEPDEESGVIGSNSADFDEAEFTRSLKDRKETQEIISVVLGGINQVSDWTIDYALGYSYAEEDESGRQDTDFAGPDASLSYTRLGDYPNYTLGADAYDPANFTLDEIVIENNLVEDTEYSLEFNAARQLSFGSAPGEIKFGAKTRQREKERESDIDVYDDFGDDDITAEQFAGGDADYDLRPFGFTLNRGSLRGFASGLDDDSLNADATLTESTVGDYNIDEDIYAAYVMASVDFDRVSVIGGVRYEYTEFESQGFLGTVYESDTLDIEDTGFGSSDQDGDYDHILPSLLVRWDYDESIVLRGAASQTIARPSFGGINPSSLAEIEEEGGDTELQIEDLGNQDLDPYESINLDFSAEWYPKGDIGVLSAGLFYKDIDDYIAQANVAGSIDLTPWTSLVGLTPADIDDADVLQFVNGDDAEVIGIELAWYRTFDSGFLVGANATFTDSEATFDGRDVDLPGASDEIGNLILGYQKYGLQARVAVNYKSEALRVVGGDSSEDVYEDEYTRVDASIAYDIMDGMQVYFEGANLTDEPFFLYQGNDNFNWQYEEYGRTYVIGVRVTNF